MFPLRHRLDGTNISRKIKLAHNGWFLLVLSS